MSGNTDFWRNDLFNGIGHPVPGNNLFGAERIGATGVEAAAEAELSGKHGGTLYLLGPDGKVIQPIAKSDPSPAQSVTITLDGNLQKYAQKAIAGF